MSVVLAVIAGGIGALVRAEVTELRGRREGTALVNLAGAALPVSYTHLTLPTIYSV